MRAARTIVFLGASTLGVVTAGCMGSGDDSVSVAPAPATGDAALADAGGDAAEAAAPATDAAQTASPPAKDSSATVAGIRIANWSPGAPAIDMCIAKHGTGAFRGPMLGNLAGGDDAGTPVLSFPYASAYTYVSPGQYDARLVVAGATNCSAGIGADVTSLPALSADGYATIAIIGETNAPTGVPGITVVGFLDDAFSAPGSAAVRFINAAPAASMVLADLGVDVGSTFAPLFFAVHYGQTGNASEAMVTGALPTSVDLFGYGAIAPLQNATVGLRARNGAGDLAAGQNVSIAAGAVVTFVAVGTTELVECVDNAGTQSYQGLCAVVSGGGDAGLL